jgi:hypothetical protein
MNKFLIILLYQHIIIDVKKKVFQLTELMRFLVDLLELLSKLDQENKIKEFILI